MLGHSPTTHCLLTGLQPEVLERVRSEADETSLGPWVTEDAELSVVVNQKLRTDTWGRGGGGGSAVWVSCSGCPGRGMGRRTQRQPQCLLA